MLIDHSDVVGHHFDRLRGLQVAVHLDNFGTGYASLSYLQRYPVDALKLDKSFVARMGTPGNDGDGGAIVKLARELGMGLIAEGGGNRRARRAAARARLPARAGLSLLAAAHRQRHGAAARQRIGGSVAAGRLLITASADARAARRGRGLSPG